jgi:LuxR family maltose regulon positive regulatory protein
VLRERLLARLDQTLLPGVRLALISAPAGFGKTSLLAEWMVKRPGDAAWLALDEGDNPPGVFLTYLLGALERARPAPSQKARRWRGPRSAARRACSSRRCCRR